MRPEKRKMRFLRTLAPKRPYQLRWLLGFAVFAGGAAWADTVGSPDLPTLPKAQIHASAAADADLSVLTFNVKGLPWPVAQARPAALRSIGHRLALMRRTGQQPGVVVLQEAFTSEARQIGDAAGYRYQVHGSYLRGPGADQTEDAQASGKWYLGETQDTPLDSGLVILSDHPVRLIHRAAFPNGSCAGFDCLAAKGTLLVTLELESGPAVEILTTHFNSRAASHAAPEDAQAAYERQAKFLGSFVRRHHDPRLPLVLAGDFNMGQRPQRQAALLPQIKSLGNASGKVREAMAERLTSGGSPLKTSTDAKIIHRRARDMQFMIDGTAQGIEAVALDIPFGTERDGSMLSDHMGFTAHYRLRGRRHN